VYANGIQNGYKQILRGSAYPHTVYAHLFTHEGAEGTEYVIQYWFFYPFNDFINDHEGDWEHINVVIDSDDPCTAEITRAIYYFHESFIVCETAQTENPTTFDFYVTGGSHPVVFVGGYGEREYYGSIGSGPGSHGCYPVYGEWSAVANIKYGFLTFFDVNEDVHSQGQMHIPWCHIVSAKQGDDYGVIVLKNGYNYSVHPEMSWLAANILWGYPYVHTFCTQNEIYDLVHHFNTGNTPPNGPVYSSVWDIVDSETTKFKRYYGMANGLTHASDAGWTPPNATFCSSQVPWDCDTPEVVLYTPNGGEHYRTNQTIPITWHVEDDNPDGVVCSVAFNAFGGVGLWSVLASDIHVDTNGDGQYNYRVPSGNSTLENCRIRVLVFDSARREDLDMSDNDFELEQFGKPPDEPVIPDMEKVHPTAGFPGSTMPERTMLNAPFPNPFNPTTTIRFTLKEATVVSLVIFDVNGNVIKEFCHDIMMPQGEHFETWSGENSSGFRVASGIYFLQLRVGDYSETKRLILLR